MKLQRCKDTPSCLGRHLKGSLAIVCLLALTTPYARVQTGLDAQLLHIIVELDAQRNAGKSSAGDLPHVQTTNASQACDQSTAELHMPATFEGPRQNGTDVPALLTSKHAPPTSSSCALSTNDQEQAAEAVDARTGHHVPSEYADNNVKHSEPQYAQARTGVPAPAGADVVAKKDQRSVGTPGTSRLHTLVICRTRNPQGCCMLHQLYLHEMPPSFQYIASAHPAHDEHQKIDKSHKV